MGKDNEAGGMISVLENMAASLRQEARVLRNSRCRCPACVTTQPTQPSVNLDDEGRKHLDAYWDGFATALEREAADLEKIVRLVKGGGGVNTTIEATRLLADLRLAARIAGGLACDCTTAKTPHGHGGSCAITVAWEEALEGAAADIAKRAAMRAYFPRRRWT